MNRYGKRVELKEEAKNNIILFDREIEKSYCRSQIELSSISKLEFSDEFINDYPVELEVGFGTGKFFVAYLNRNPKINYIGIENSKKLADNGANQILENKISTAKIINVDAVFYLKAKIKKESLDKIHIYFPDPWFKKRHIKRRLINIEFLDICYSALKKDGKLIFFTDHSGYFEYFKDTVTEHNQFVFSKENTDYSPTSYEDKWIARGRVINRSILKKQ